ncbi:unnamed protein product [Rhodiola kirilowii]
MEGCMRDSTRKLALWYTKTFKPITTHEELEPIMATLSFVSVITPSQPDDGGIGTVAWKEYVYVAGGGRGRFGEMTPKPRNQILQEHVYVVDHQLVWCHIVIDRFVSGTWFHVFLVLKDTVYWVVVSYKISFNIPF